MTSISGRTTAVEPHSGGFTNLPTGPTLQTRIVLAASVDTAVNSVIKSPAMLRTMKSVLISMIYRKIISPPLTTDTRLLSTTPFYVQLRSTHTRLIPKHTIITDVLLLREAGVIGTPARTVMYIHILPGVNWTTAYLLINSKTASEAHQFSGKCSLIAIILSDNATGLQKPVIMHEIFLKKLLSNRGTYVVQYLQWYTPVPGRNNLFQVCISMSLVSWFC